MKKRNLFLSLVCSIILTVALVAVTIASIIVPSNGNKGNNGNNGSNISDVVKPDPEPEYPSNDENDGSAEKPYIIYNAESFIDLISEYGDQNKNFELDRDIDFAETEFVTLFNDKAFNGTINGKGHSLKNITVSVNVSNLDKFIVKDAEEKYVANVAVFGKISNATITNIEFKELNIAVADEVYAYIRGTEFAADHEAAFKQLTVAGVAAIADDSTISANVEATINADAYSVYAKDYVQGFNALGGVVGVANGLKVKDSYVKVIVNTTAGEHYFVGGVAGYAYSTTVEGTTVELSIESSYKQALYIGGVAGYALNTTISNSGVILNQTQSGDRVDLSLIETLLESKTTSTAGIINVIRADDENQITKIDTVSVKANVDADVMFAGVTFEVRNKDLTAGVVTDKRLVSIKDVIVDANVNVLKAFGFAKKLVATTVEFTDEVFGFDVNLSIPYNIRLTGKVLLNDNDETTVSSMFVTNIVELSTGNKYVDVVGGYKNVKVVVSSSIYTRCEKGETTRALTVTVAD